LNSFSQKDTEKDSAIVQIKPQIARFVISDLTKFDFAKKKIENYKVLDSLNQKKLKLKRSKINTLQEEVSNLNTTIELLKEQKSITSEINKDLKQEVKKQRTGKTIFQIGGLALSISLGILYILK